MADSPVQDTASNELQGRVAIVTGGGSGIGRSCVDLLRACGARVVAADSSFSEHESAPHAIACDVTEEVSVRRLFQAVLEGFGRVDILVNSAGVVEKARRTAEQDLAHWEQVMSVNAKGTFLCCREAGNIMVPQRSGAIVNIGSVAGLVGIPGSNAYGPSKAAVAHMTRSLACEWARFGVRVNCIAPGYVDAPMAHALFRGDPAVRETALTRVPLGRVASATELAHAVLFMCSPRASYVTGAVLPVDGGWSAFGGASR